MSDEEHRYAFAFQALEGLGEVTVAVKAKGTPGGMALGNATGDSGWTHWLMWAFGGKIVDKDNKVVIDSPETIKALEYAKELYPTFVPGTLSSSCSVTRSPMAS